MIVAGRIHGFKPAWRVRLSKVGNAKPAPFTILATGETEAAAIADAIGRAERFFTGSKFKAVDAARTL